MLSLYHKKEHRPRAVLEKSSEISVFYLSDYEERKSADYCDTGYHTDDYRKS